MADAQGNSPAAPLTPPAAPLTPPAAPPPAAPPPAAPPPAPAVTVAGPPPEPVVPKITDEVEEGEAVIKEAFKLIPVGNSGWALYYAALMAKNLELGDKSEVTSQKVLELVERVKTALQNPASKDQIRKNMAAPDTLTQLLEDPFIYKSQKGRPRFTNEDDYIAKLSILQVSDDFNKGPEAYPDIQLVSNVLPNILEITVVLFTPTEGDEYTVAKVFKPTGDSLGTIFLIYINRENVDVLREKSYEELDKGPQKRTIKEILKGNKMKFESALLKAKQSLKTAASTIGKKLKGIAGLAPGVISIAGIETVNTRDEPSGDVEFIGNYFIPEEDMSVEDVNIAAKPMIEIFNRIFAGKTYSESNPLLPPCVDAERKILMHGLMLRINRLTDETIGKAMREGFIHDISVKTNTLSRLNLLKDQLEHHIKNGKCRDYNKEGSPEQLIKIKTQMDENARLWLRKILFSALQVYNPVPAYQHLTQDAKDTVAQLSKNPLTEDDLEGYIKIWREQQEYLGEGIPEILGRILDQLDVQPGLLDVMLTDELKNLLDQLIKWVTEDYATGFAAEPEKVQDFRDYAEGLKTSTLNVKQRIVELIRWITRKNIECWRELEESNKEREKLKEVIEKQIDEIKDLDDKLDKMEDIAEKLLGEKGELLEKIKVLNDNVVAQRGETEKANARILVVESELSMIKTLNKSTTDQKDALQLQLNEYKAKELELTRLGAEKEKAAAAALEAQNTAAAALQVATDKKASDTANTSALQAEIAKLKGDLAAAEAKTASAEALAVKGVKANPPSIGIRPRSRVEALRARFENADKAKAARAASPPAGPPAGSPATPPPPTGLKGGGDPEDDMNELLSREQQLRLQLQDAVGKYQQVQGQNEDFREGLKLAEKDLLKMGELTATHNNKRIEAEGKLAKLQNEVDYMKEEAETRNGAQAQKIVSLTGDAEGLRARLKQIEAVEGVEDKKHDEELKKLQTDLGQATQRAAAAESNDAAQKAKIDELNMVAAKVAELSEQQNKEKEVKLAELQAQIEELRKTQVAQKSTEANKDFYVKLRTYAINLLDNGNAGDPDGIVKGSPAFMELYRKTHVLATNVSGNGVKCFLNLFAEAILKEIFANDVADNRNKIDAIIEAYITQLKDAARKDKITRLLKTLSVLVDKYKAGTPLEDQATYYAIYDEYSKVPLAAVPTIVPDTDNIFFTRAAPPTLGSTTDLPYSVVFVMLLLSLKKYIQEHRANGTFMDEACDKINKAHVDAPPASTA